MMRGVRRQVILTANRARRREHEVVPIRAEVVRTAGRRRVAVGQEKPHPSVQRRYADLGGYRIPALAADTPHEAGGPTSNLGTAAEPAAKTAAASPTTSA
jgi:hypothetical protein